MSFERAIRPAIATATATVAGQPLLRFALVGLIVLLLSFQAVAMTAGMPGLFYYQYDRFADFIEVVLALPGAPAAPGPWDWMVRRYAASLAFHGPDSVLHLPPFSMLLTLLARRAFVLASPVLIYCGLAALSVAALVAVVQRHSRDVFWSALAALSYPVLFALDRGNLYALLSAVVAIAALLGKRSSLTAALLMAVAINVRPNLAICALPLLMFNLRFALWLAAFALTLFGASLLAAHALYPAYDLTSFRADLQHYSTVIVPSADALSFGSSIFGLFFAAGWTSSLLAALIGLAPLPVAVWLRSTGRFGYDEFLFVCAAASGLATPAFGNYHLLIFVAPLLLARGRLVAVGSLLMLVPKGYALVGGLNLQLFLNPAIMLAVSVALLARAARRPAIRQLFAASPWDAPVRAGANPA